MSKILLRVFPILFLFMALYGAPTTMGPMPMDEKKFSIDAGSDVFSSTNDMFTRFVAGARYGIGKGWDVGLSVYEVGGILDFRYLFLHNNVIMTTVDFETGYSGQKGTAWLSGALILGVDITSFLCAYLTARWRGPAIFEVDTPFNVVSENFTGMGFYPRFGIELFRNWNFPILLEAGFAKTWNSAMLGYVISAKIAYVF